MWGELWRVMESGVGVYVGVEGVYGDVYGGRVVWGYVWRESVEIGSTHVRRCTHTHSNWFMCIAITGSDKRG